MKNYKHLSDAELRVQTKLSADQERACAMVVIDHLREVERRRSYAQWSYRSLTEYCMVELLYSYDQARRRVDAMRLLYDVPEAESSIADGKLSMTAAHQLQQFFERANINLSEDKKEIFEQVDGKSTREAEKIFVSICPLPVPKQTESEKVLTPDFVELKLIVNQKFLGLFQETVELLSESQLNTPGYVELFTQLLQEKVAKLKADKTKRSVNKKSVKSMETAAPRRNTPEHSTKGTESVNGTPPSELASTKLYLSVHTQRTLIKRDGHQCTHKDPVTKRRCRESKNLEPDHILPRAQGGTNSLENLRLACRTHNLFYAIQTFGREKMSQYMQRI